mgnify:FL=1
MGGPYAIAAVIHHRLGDSNTASKYVEKYKIRFGFLFRNKNSLVLE